MLERKIYCHMLRTLVLIILVLPVSAYCIELGTEKLRLRGFGTIGITASGEDVLYAPSYLSKNSIDSTGTFWDESLLGIQLDGTIADSFEASVQYVFRDRYDNSFNEHLERAFLKYFNEGLLIRAGRIGLDIYMLSEYRNVGFAYLWAHPPMEFYGAFAIDYYDGAEIGYKFELPMGTLQARFYGGGVSQSIEQGGEISDLVYAPFYGTTFIWTHESLLLRLGLARAEADSDLQSLSLLRNSLSDVNAIWPEAEDLVEDLELEGTSYNYFSIGAVYDASPWIVQSELSYMDSEAKLFQSYANGYLSLGYVIDSVTPFTVGGFNKPVQDRVEISDAPFSSLDELQQGVQSLYDATGVDQKTLSVGVRWNVMDNVALKAQWDHSWVEAYGGGLWSSDVANDESLTIDTYSLNLSFIF